MLNSDRFYRSSSIQRHLSLSLRATHIYSYLWFTSFVIYRQDQLNPEYLFSSHDTARFYIVSLQLIKPCFANPSRVKPTMHNTRCFNIKDMSRVVSIYLFISSLKNHLIVDLFRRSPNDLHTCIELWIIAHYDELSFKPYHPLFRIITLKIFCEHYFHLNVCNIAAWQWTLSWKTFVCRLTNICSRSNHTVDTKWLLCLIMIVRTQHVIDDINILICNIGKPSCTITIFNLFNYINVPFYHRCTWSAQYLSFCTRSSKHTLLAN